LSQNGQEQTRSAGKASFTSIYDRATPNAYFTELKALEYDIPGQASGVVKRCIAALRDQEPGARLKVLDLAAGYGINGALATASVTMQDLYDRFAHPSNQETESQIAKDRLWFAQKRSGGRRLRFIAQDVAGNALAYAKAVGMVDETICRNLESESLSEREREMIADTDLIVVTGGLSYIGTPTIQQVLGALRKRRPWLLYVPLRHTDTEELDGYLEDLGYIVEMAPATFFQRRFKNAREQEVVRETIFNEADPGEPIPSKDYLEARLKIARPLSDRNQPPIEDLVQGIDYAEELYGEAAATDYRQAAQSFQD